MKKNFMMGMFALAALAMTSCSMNDVVSEQDNAINFGTYLGRGVQTKAHVETIETLKANDHGFGVFASYTNEDIFIDSSPLNFMFNQKVIWNNSGSGAWTYSPLKYWPTDRDENITFFAYAPYETSKSIDVKSEKNATGYPVITYTLDEGKLADAEDFVADVLVNETRSATVNPDGTDRTVKFNFMHELTRVAFLAKLDREAFNTSDSNLKTQVNIKNITFGGDNLITEADYKFANTDHGRGTWAKVSGSETTLDVTELIEQSTESLGGYIVSGYRLKDGTGENLFGEGDYLFLIPMNGETGISSQTVTFTIDYDIVTIDSNLEDGYSKTSATKVITIPDNFLKQGTAYTFNLTFYLNEVVFDAVVSDWDTPTDGPENVDWNDDDKI